MDLYQALHRILVSDCHFIDIFLLKISLEFNMYNLYHVMLQCKFSKIVLDTLPLVLGNNIK